MKERSWIGWVVEFLIVTTGIVAGFQITQWGEEQESKALAAQNLARAIAEVESNIERIDRQVNTLEKGRDTLNTTLRGLIHCSPELTTVKLEEAFTIVSFDFLPALKSVQLEGLARPEFTRFYDIEFHEALDNYNENYSSLIETTKANHLAHFDWKLTPFMNPGVVKKEVGEAGTDTYRFYPSGDPGELCKDPDFVNGFWKLRVLREANKLSYEYLKASSVKVLPVMRSQLRKME